MAGSVHQQKGADWWYVRRNLMEKVVPMRKVEEG